MFTKSGRFLIIGNIRYRWFGYDGSCNEFSGLKIDAISWIGAERIKKCPAPFVHVTNFEIVTNNGVATVECTVEGIYPLKITIGDNTTTHDSSRVTLRQEVQPGRNVTCLVENTELNLSSSETVEVPNWQ